MKIFNLVIAFILLTSSGNLFSSSGSLFLESQSFQNGEIINVSETIKLTFNYDIDLNAGESITLTENGNVIEIETVTDGHSLIIEPVGGFNYNSSYRLEIYNLVSTNEVELSNPVTMDFGTIERATDFFVGGVIIDGVIKGLFGDPFDNDFLFNSLTSHGVTNFRLGTTTQINNELEDELSNNNDHVCSLVWNNNYWSSREINAYILENIGTSATNNSIFLFLSETTTHSGNYDTQNEWDDFDKTTLLQVIENHAKETASYFLNRGIIIHQYEIGNEIDYGIVGYYPGNKGVPEDIYSFDLETIKNEFWIHFVDVINAAIKGIHSVNADVKIAIHLAALNDYSETNSRPLDFYKYLIEKNVDFDVIGLSYPYLLFETEKPMTRPYFKSSEFISFMKKISELEKEIQFSEYAYNNSPDDVQVTPAEEYPTTPEGQALFVGDFLKEISKYPMVGGAYYLYPDYYPDMNIDILWDFGFYGSPYQELPILDTIYDFVNSISSTIWYQDNDGDGFGDSNNSTNATSQPSGYVSDNTDCDDTNATVYPGATEIAGDGIDQDCDGVDEPSASNAITVESDLSFTLPYAIYTSEFVDMSLWVDFTYFGDQGGILLWELENFEITTSAGNPITINSDLSFSFDGIYSSPFGDMNLIVNFIFFGEQEGKLLWELDSYTVGDSDIWYQDSDGDGYGNLSYPLTSSAQPSGYVSDHTDCNDNDASIHPGATEIAGDGIDQDCDGSDLASSDSTCGAYVAPGVWKEFDCYNLAAIGKITNDDPFTPSWRLIGGYWQWGQKGPDSSEWYDTNTANFAHGPTGPDSGDANEGSISGWDLNPAPDGSWSDDTKTANDPCPAGYRVPTYSQWDGVLDNNTQSTVGTWDSDDTNYSSARFFGNDLMLPAAGYRISTSGSLDYSGTIGYYWSSTLGASSYAWSLPFGSSYARTYSGYFRRNGFSVRCVAE